MRGDDHIAVLGGGQERLQLPRLVGVVEHDHPARVAVQLGPERLAGVLLPLVLRRPRRPRPGRPARSRCRPGRRRRSTRPPGPPGAGGRPPRAPARSCPRRPARTARRRAAGGSRRPAARSTSASSDLPADERAVPGRQVHRRAAAHRGRGRRRLLGQHGGVHPAQRRSRVDAELVGQRAPAAFERGQRVGLPAGGVQGGDQAQGQRLAQRVVRGQLLEQGHVAGRPAAPGVRVGQRLGRAHPQLLQPGSRDLRNGTLARSPKTRGPTHRSSAPSRTRGRDLVVALGQQPAGRGPRRSRTPPRPRATTPRSSR